MGLRGRGRSEGGGAAKGGEMERERRGRVGAGKEKGGKARTLMRGSKNRQRRERRPKGRGVPDESATY